MSFKLLRIFMALMLSRLAFSAVLTGVVFATSPLSVLAKETDSQFVQVSSHKSLDAAINVAQKYLETFPTAQVYLSETGYFAVMLGTRPKADVDLFIRRLVAEGKVPSDTYATAGSRFLSVAWEAGASAQSSRGKEEPSTLFKENPKTHRTSSGSGFVVSDEGHTLTNAHVVRGCSEILVDGSPSTLVDVSETFDLALLLPLATKTTGVAVFSPTSALLNSDVTAIGFPYAGLLGGLNVTRGSISSLEGPADDDIIFQMTTPIQSGNSGGPLLATDGEVVGVVVAKLDADVITELGGSVPQNVSFAVRGKIAQLFLAQNHIEARLGTDSVSIAPEALAEIGASFTTFIDCK